MVRAVCIIFVYIPKIKQRGRAQGNLHVREFYPLPPFLFLSFPLATSLSVPRTHTYVCMCICVPFFLPPIIYGLPLTSCTGVSRNFNYLPTILLRNTPTFIRFFLHVHDSLSPSTIYIALGRNVSYIANHPLRIATRKHWSTFLHFCLQNNATVASGSVSEGVHWACHQLL